MPVVGAMLVGRRGRVRRRGDCSPSVDVVTGERRRRSRARPPPRNCRRRPRRPRTRAMPRSGRGPAGPQPPTAWRLTRVGHRAPRPFRRRAVRLAGGTSVGLARGPWRVAHRIAARLAGARRPDIRSRRDAGQRPLGPRGSLCLRRSPLGRRALPVGPRTTPWADLRATTTGASLHPLFGALQLQIWQLPVKKPRSSQASTSGGSRGRRAARRPGWRCAPGRPTASRSAPASS
jgi:hypothetical protein